MTPASKTTSDRLAVARLWAATHFSYFASALFAMEVVITPRVSEASIDQSWRLYVNPDASRAWTEAEIGSLLVHHVGHLLRDHAERAHARGVSEQEGSAWLRAADAEINDDLLEAGVCYPGEFVLPSDFGAAPGRLAEEYFDLLCGGSVRSGHGAGHRIPSSSSGGHDEAPACGSGADGMARTWEEPSSGPVSQSAARLLRWQTAHELERYAHQAGRVPASWQRWAAGLLRPTIDWRAVLGAELRRGLVLGGGAVDYSYGHVSRRAAVSWPILLPSLRAPQPEVAIVCDTSASVDTTMLEHALGEVTGILRASGTAAASARVISCDAAIQSVRRVTSASQVTLLGGGGTDMGVGIDKAAALWPRPDVVVVLTDGRTPWPPAGPRSARVVVGLLGATAAPPPAWARSVRIGAAP